VGVDGRSASDADLARAAHVDRVAVGSAPRGGVERQVGIAAVDLDDVANGERLERPRDQDVSPAIEAEVVKDDTHRR
jgi:hypothetical protein